MIDLDARMDEVHLAFLDVETTGLDPNLGDRVCEVAVLRCTSGEVVDALQHLVNPQRPMGSGAYAVHGISDEMLCDAPFFSHIVDDVLEILDGAVFVGHNAPFDLGFLAAELGYLGVDMPRLVALDTLRLARRTYHLRSYALGRVAQALGIEASVRAHRAMADVVTTRALLDRLVDDLWPRGLRSVRDYLGAQGGALSYSRPRQLDVPPVIQEAIRNDRPLFLHYVSESGQESRRLVRPHRVLERGGNLVLLAHCHLRDAQRTFRLDRIIGVELVDGFE